MESWTSEATQKQDISPISFAKSRSDTFVKAWQALWSWWLLPVWYHQCLHQTIKLILDSRYQIASQVFNKYNHKFQVYVHWNMFNYGCLPSPNPCKWSLFPDAVYNQNSPLFTTQNPAINNTPDRSYRSVPDHLQLQRHRWQWWWTCSWQGRFQGPVIKCHPFGGGSNKQRPVDLARFIKVTPNPGDPSIFIWLVNRDPYNGLL